MTYAPVVIFTYNRPRHTAETLRALAANTLAKQTPLIVYSDAPKSEADLPQVEHTRLLHKDITGFNSVAIYERERNFGLADSITDGVTTTVHEYGRAIVLEDDIVTSPHFLEYMNTALVRYEHEERVMHIAAHIPQISPDYLPESFFLRLSSCWGWATWARAWRHFHRQGQKFIKSFTPEDIRLFNLDGAYDYWRQLLANENGALRTWAVYWYACVFSLGGLCLHPRQSLVQNIGFDGSGENCGIGESDASVFKVKAPMFYPDILEEDGLAIRRYERQLRWMRLLGRLPKIWGFFKGLLNA